MKKPTSAPAISTSESDILRAIFAKELKDFPELEDSEISREKDYAKYAIPTLDLMDAIFTYAPKEFLKLAEENNAKYGKSPDTVLVEDFLHSLCDGHYAIPKTVLSCALKHEKCVPNPPSIPPELVRIILEAIAYGDYKRIRSLAGIVKNVFERRDTTKDKLTFRPVKPAKLATLENAKKSGTVRVSGKDIAADGISVRSAQRLARIAGAKPAKSGRKKKLFPDTPAPKKKPDTVAALKRVFESYPKKFKEKSKRKK